jgi:lipopolysaccharide transport system ATP-binding protein
MSTTVISVENLSKRYRLGVISGGTLRADLERWWARVRRKPDPLLKIGQIDHRNRSGEYIWALKDVNIEIKQGEVLGIIGRNGAGKSTLLKILSRVTAPTSGLVKINGRLASLLEIGTGFHPELTGRENIHLNGAILGMKTAEIARKVEAIVDFSGVEQFIDTPVKRYSSGMYLRLAFAVAAHLEASILVVDEVLAVGDAEFQNKCLGKISNVASAGRTVLFVSHNMAAVSKLCGRGIVLTRGQVSFDGPAGEAVRTYLGTTTELAGEQIDLSGRTVRSRDIEVVGGCLLHDGVVTNSLISGDPICLRIELNARVAAKFSVELILRDAYGLPVAFSPSGLAFGVEFKATPGRSVVTCRVKDLVLAKGLYYLDIVIADAGVGFLDYIQSALRINVSDTHIGPKSWQFDQKRGQGCILLKTDFSYLPCESCINV